MNFHAFFLRTLVLAAVAGATSALAQVKPATFDLAAIRNPSTLETRIVQDWKPAAGDPSIRQKVVEITVCEWWAGQRVRIPVTFNVPAAGGRCRHVIVTNMGFAARPFLPEGAVFRLLKRHGVGVILAGMSAIEAMAPAEKLLDGMKEQLLKTKDARYTPAWIWGMSDMRALTAAIAETEAFRPEKVLATGASKRGVAAAIAGIHDERFTAIAPVVATPLGHPGGAYVVGTDPADLDAIDDRFLRALAAGEIPGLPTTTRAALLDREARRGNERITLRQAKDAGWPPEDIAALNDRAWDAACVTRFLPALRHRGLELFYNVGTNDNASPTLLELGRQYPDFPLYIVPGGQHGGPKDAGFTRVVFSDPDVEDNLYAFALHHFSGARALIATPRIRHEWDTGRHRLRVTVTFPDGTEPQTNELWWSLDRHPANTLPYEYDAWHSTALRKTGPADFSGEAVVSGSPRTVDFLSTHRHVQNELALSVSSPLQRINVR